MARKDPVAQLSGHVVICNCNDKIRAIVEDLQAGTAYNVLDVVLIVQDNTLWESNIEWHPRCRDDAIFKTIFGCPTDKTVLNQAGISRARAAIILSDPLHGELADAPATLTAIAIERENPQVHTIIELIHSVNRGHLETTAVNEVICLGEITENLIAQSCITPGVKNIFKNLLSVERGSPQIFIRPLPGNCQGMTFKQVARRLIEKEAPYILIGFVKQNANAESEFVINPPKDAEPGKYTPLADGDRLVIIAHDPPDVGLRF